MQHSKYFIPTIAFLFSSCISFYGITNDYDWLTNEQKEKVLKLESFDGLDSKNIYEINGTQLKNEMKNHPKSLVYTFANGCGSKMCKPLFVYENYAKENGYKIFLLMHGYANLKATTSQKFENPLFAIDFDYYGSEKRSECDLYFENDLKGLPRTQKNKGKYEGSIYFFEGDSLVKIMRELPTN